MINTELYNYHIIKSIKDEKKDYCEIMMEYFLYFFRY
jgi:hypothetical protein